MLSRQALRILKLERLLEAGMKAWTSPAGQVAEESSKMDQQYLPGGSGFAIPRECRCWINGRTLG